MAYRLWFGYAPLNDIMATNRWASSNRRLFAPNLKRENTHETWKGGIQMSKNKCIVINRPKVSNNKEPQRAVNGAKKEPKLPKGFSRILIPALDILIGDPMILEPQEDTKLKAYYMYIPTQYIHILGELRNKNSSSYVSESAARVLHTFSHYMLDMHHKNDAEFYTCANGMKIKFIDKRDQDFETLENPLSASVATLATARHYTKQHARQVAIFTGDDEMICSALSEKIHVAVVNPEVYTGRRKLAMPKEAWDTWEKQGYLTRADFKKFFPNEAPLRINEFVEFVLGKDVPRAKREDYSWFIGRFWKGEVNNAEEKEESLDETPVDEMAKAKDAKKKKKGQSVIAEELKKREEGEKTEEKKKPRLLALHRLSYIRQLKPARDRALMPRSAGQAMLVEALLAPYSDIPIVICPSTFGTGKTYLSTAVGIKKVEEGEVEEVFVCPRDSRLGDQTGALPGDLFAKVIDKAKPIVDNVKAYIKNKRDKIAGGAEKNHEQIMRDVMKLIQDYFELDAIINMGGRSIADSYMIYDEAQDLERGQIRQLMERIGDCSKMVILGDPEQVSNHHMNSRSNGVSYAASKMKNNWAAAIVSMTSDEIERCLAAREIAKCFGY